MPGNEYVLLIHGFTGGPHEVRPLAPYLQRAGYRVEMLRIAGHGKTPEQLKKSNRFSWYSSVKKQCLRYKTYPCHLLGFSMGGLLAARFAAEYQKKTRVKSLILVGTPYRIFSFRNWLHHAWEKLNASKTWGDGLQEMVKGVGRMKIVPLESLLDFSLLLNESKGYFQRVNVPACVIQGERDHLVHPSSGKTIYRHLPLSRERKELHYIANGQHELFLSHALPQTAEIILAFLRKQNRKS
ncbi:carboxylesterase [Bacillaceae bacterium]